METKLAKLQRAMRLKDWTAALRIAGKFYDLGDHKAAILRARAAQLSPNLYRQMGLNPAELIEEGKRALVERYGAQS